MLNGLRTNCYKVTMLFQRQGDKKSVWICPAHPHTIYAFITKELRLKRFLVKFQNNFFRHFTRIARRTHIGNSRSGQTRQVFFLNAQFRQMLRDTYLDRQCLHRLNSRLRSLFLAHAILVHIHRLGDIYIFGQSSRSIELHNDRHREEYRR